MGVRKPRVVSTRSDRPIVRVRGARDAPALVVSRQTSVIWRRSPQTHAVQLSHEMAHIWSGDLLRYYFRSTAILVLTVELAAYSLGNGAGDRRIIVVSTLAALLSLQSYLRSREHAADFMASQVLGPSARDELAGSSPPHGFQVRLFRTHPSVGARRSAFDDPAVLFHDARSSVFSLGFLSLFLLDMILRFERFQGIQTGHLPFVLSAVGVGVLAGCVLGNLLTYGGMVESQTIRSWYRGVLLGLFSYLVAAQQSPYNIRVVVAALLVAVLLAKVAAAASELLWLVVPDVEELGRSRSQFVHSIIPSIVWIAFVLVIHYGVLLRLVRVF